MFEFRLTKQEQICPECGKALHEMRKEVRRELEWMGIMTRYFMMFYFDWRNNPIDY